MLEWSFDTRDSRAARETRIEFAKHVDRLYGAQGDAAAAELILGELISNVVRYAPGIARVQATFDESGVTIAVHDHGKGFSVPGRGRETALLNESGRGLAIVSLLAKRVEIECQDDDGCCVRARLDVRRWEAAPC